MPMAPKTDAEKVAKLREMAKDKSLPQDVRNQYLDQANMLEEKAAKGAGVRMATGGAVAPKAQVKPTLITPKNATVAMKRTVPTTAQPTAPVKPVAPKPQSKFKLITPKNATVSMTKIPKMAKGGAVKKAKK